MNISVIVAHPERGSLNHAIAAESAAVLREGGHQVNFHDLYAEQFPPLLVPEEMPREGALPVEIQRHCLEIAAADGIVIVHPNWWGQPPAILKGWIDRVLRPGVAYEFIEGDDGDGVPNGLLPARAAVVFNTSNTEVQRERLVFGDPLEAIWKNCIFELCGVAEVHRRMFSIVVTSTPEERQGWLAEVRQTILRVYPPDESH